MSLINGTVEKIDGDGDVATDHENEDIVDPWNVAASSSTGVDYDKLIGRCIIFHFFCAKIKFFCQQTILKIKIPIAIATGVKSLES